MQVCGGKTKLLVVVHLLLYTLFVYLITWHYLPQMPSGFFYSQCGESMGEIYIFSLQILANLCRANVSVQAFMKGLVCKRDEFLLHVYSSKIMYTST